MRILLLTGSLLLSSSFAIANDTKTQFKAAYTEYNQLVNNGSRDLEKLKAFGQKSYQLGCEVYGQQSENCIALMVNYANYIAKMSRREALDVFELAIDKQAENDQSNGNYPSISLADYLLSLANLQRPQKAAKTLAKVDDIADEFEESEPVQANVIRLGIGAVYLQHGDPKSRILKESYQALKDELPANSETLIEARINLGKYYQAKRKHKKAIPLYEENIAVFEPIEDYTHPYELYSRAFLVSAYSKAKQSDEATKHCIAIGKMKPWQEDQEQIPLYQQHPIYPVSMARRGAEGWVKMRFTISEIGMVEDIEVIESTHSGFEKESIKALENWRYAPKFVDGKAVLAKGLTVQLDYKMG